MNTHVIKDSLVIMSPRHTSKLDSLQNVRQIFTRLHVAELKYSHIPFIMTSQIKTQGEGPILGQDKTGLYSMPQEFWPSFLFDLLY